jgi:hypothetical protein
LLPSSASLINQYRHRFSEDFEEIALRKYERLRSQHNSVALKEYF